MIKAPLDEKNISPSQIIDDLTNCDNIQKDNTAVGYMYHTPVLFEYTDNIMRIIFRKGSDFLKHKCDIRKYIKDMAENTKHLYVNASYTDRCADMRFYWKEEEEE